MKIGSQVPSFTSLVDPARLGGKLSEIARTAYEADFASLRIGNIRV